MPKLSEAAGTKKGRKATVVDTKTGEVTTTTAPVPIGRMVTKAITGVAFIDGFTMRTVNAGKDAYRSVYDVVLEVKVDSISSLDEWPRLFNRNVVTIKITSQGQGRATITFDCPLGAHQLKVIKVAKKDEKDYQAYVFHASIPAAAIHSLDVFNGLCARQVSDVSLIHKQVGM